eukprot:CAMPEP_0194064338 /NCGR_PEP_ID=MMETSP0009_2-20130614/82704_1 /TAXON_ID=210454 /ORGANISM="Grammatophora oceanica, Strain CCMP 410" /LENGTH=299 /DNA_ID=CAMNT_0038716785 /DNA_START=143 /DNA_END=1039 /DNA_ORIENTATION=+
MGCGSSTQAAPAVAPEEMPDVAAKSLPSQEQARPIAGATTATPANSVNHGAGPKPMPFAIMRNCHETIRQSFHKELDAALEADDLNKFDTHFQDLKRGLAFHTKLEEHNGFFAFLDHKYDNVTQKAGLWDLHKEELELEAAVDAAMEKKDMKEVKSAYEALKTHTLDHLTEEEKVMMPKIKDIGTEVKFDPLEMGRIFNESILRNNFGDGQEMAWFVSWNARILAKHGSTSSPDGFTAMRTFVWGCQYACTEEQWDAIWPTVKKDLTIYFPEMYEKLQEENDIEGRGKVEISADESDVW